MTLHTQGSLFLLPFGALQDGNGKFLIERYTILIAPAIQVLDLARQRQQEVGRIGDGSILVVGNPTMPIDPLSESPKRLDPLPGSEAEAKVIASLLNTQSICGNQATKIDIVKQMPQARLIHLATHGLLDSLQSEVPGAIAFAPSSDDDGFLTAEEILTLELSAELVVLSACHTGQGRITGDGVVGLSRSFIAAGVHSVIVSLWSVNDLSTTLLMVKFYEFYENSQGKAPAIALNQAQYWLLSITKKELNIWFRANQEFFSPTLKMQLHRQLHQMLDDAQPFQKPFKWAAFYAIGQ